MKISKNTIIKLLNWEFKMKKMFLALISLFVISFNANAQNSETKLGFYGLVNFNNHPGLSLAEERLCCDYNKGKGTAFTTGVSIESSLSNAWGIGVGIEYFDYSAKFDKYPEVLTRIGIDSIGNSQIKYELNCRLSSLGVAPFVKYKIADGLNCKLGFHLGYVVIKDYDEQASVTDSLRFQTPDGPKSTITTISKRSIPTGSVWNFAGNIGLFYDIALNADKSLFISPMLEASYGFVPVAKTEEFGKWDYYTLKCGLALKFSL